MGGSPHKLGRMGLDWGLKWPAHSSVTVECRANISFCRGGCAEQKVLGNLFH